MAHKGLRLQCPDFVQIQPRVLHQSPKRIRHLLRLFILLFSFLNILLLSLFLLIRQFLTGLEKVRHQYTVRVQLARCLATGHPQGLDVSHPVGHRDILRHLRKETAKVFGKIIITLELRVGVGIRLGSPDMLVDSGLNDGEIVQVLQLHGILTNSKLLRQILSINRRLSGLDGSHLLRRVFLRQPCLLLRGVRLEVLPLHIPLDLKK